MVDPECDAPVAVHRARQATLGAARVQSEAQEPHSESYLVLSPWTAAAKTGNLCARDGAALLGGLHPPVVRPRLAIRDKYWKIPSDV